MSFNSKDLRTVSGASFYEVASAFQKYVRRGMEHEALWCATELYMSTYEEYVWYRIKVMVSEDIGLANLTLPAQIEALYQNYVVFKKKKAGAMPERLPMVHAVLLICRSPKSRIVDNLLCKFWDHRNKFEAPEFPDFVYDMHTLKGKQKKRGNDHFYEEAAHIENGTMPEEYEIRDEVWEMYKKDDQGPQMKMF